MAEMGPELVTEDSVNDWMLRQGTNRLNQGHDSDGSGWGSQGSCARGEGSVTAQSRLRQDDCGSDQGKGALVAEVGKPRGRRQQSAAVNWDSGRASLGAQGTAGRCRASLGGERV